MPANKFHGFYYGVGMKLDEASVDKAGQQLEGRLNKVVDNVLKEVGNISTAVSKGMGEVDTKALTNALKEARGELDAFQDFDPKQLQTQIDGLKDSIKGITDVLGESGEKLKAFSEDIATRLSNIEIKASEQGIKAFKNDLELMADYAQKMLNSGKIDTSGLDKYLRRVKDGFASLKASGNSMELFADQDIAKYFVNITNVLQQMGAPVEDLRLDFFELSSTFKKIFEKASGATSVFKNIGYQIEATNNKLKQAKLNIADYETEISRLENEMRDWHKITDDGDQVLIDNFQAKQTKDNLQAIIDQLQKYDTLIATASKDKPDFESYEKLIALSQKMEGIMSEMGKKKSKPFLEMWAEQLSGFDVSDLVNYKINDYSTGFLTEYRSKLQNAIDGIKNLPEYQELQKVIGEQTVRLETLMQGKGSSSSRTQKEKINPGIVGEVEIKPIIDDKKWADTINQALQRLSGTKDGKDGKVRPFNLKVQATSKKLLAEIDSFRKATEKALVNEKNEGKSDVTAFNNRFNNFKKNLEDRKKDLVDYLRNDYQKQLKDAFQFRFEVLGMDKQSLTDNIDKYLLSLVDVINTEMDKKPIQFKSNIDALIEEIKSKLENLDITSNVNVNGGAVTGSIVQVPSNVSVILGGLTQAATTATTSIQNLASATDEGTKQEEKKTDETKKRGRPSKAIENGTGKKQTPAQKKAEEELAALPGIRLKNGQEIVRHYIRLAQLAKELSAIAEIADKPITADMFANGEIEKWIRGKKYTKEDIGSFAPGKHLTEGTLGTFLQTMGITPEDLATANTREEREFLTPLKKYIFAFLQNRYQLNSLLQTLMDSQKDTKFIEGYNDAEEDKTSYLASSFANTYKTLMSNKSKASDKQYVTDILAKYNVDLSSLPTAGTYAEQWKIIQSELINKDGLDFNGLMSELGSLKGNVGKVYQNFMTILQVAKAYASTSDSLKVVGQEANAIVQGRTEQISKEDSDRKVKYKNSITGLWEETNEYKGYTKIVQQGIRSMLRNLKVVFEDEMGRTLLGYGLGKGVIPDDKFVGGNSSYTKIIQVLTSALSEASKLMFDPQFQQGAQLERWRYDGTQPNEFKNPYKVSKSNVTQISEYIQNTDYLIKGQKRVIESNKSHIQQLQDKIAELKKDNADVDVSQYETEIARYTEDIKQK